MIVLFLLMQYIEFSFLIKFVTDYCLTNLLIIVDIYKGFSMYINFLNEKNKLHGTNRNSFKNIFMFLSIYFYNKPFDKNDWQYYPNICVTFIYLFIIIPYIIYIISLANVNKQIRYDYLFSLIISTISVVLSIFYDHIF